MTIGLAMSRMLILKVNAIPSPSITMFTPEQRHWWRTRTAGGAATEPFRMQYTKARTKK